MRDGGEERRRAWICWCVVRVIHLPVMEVECLVLSVESRVIDHVASCECSWVRLLDSAGQCSSQWGMCPVC